MKTGLFKVKGLFIVILLTFSLGLSTVTVCAAELDEEPEPDIDYPYAYVSDAYCTLSISAGSATVSSAVYGKVGTTSTSVTVYLEKRINGIWQYYNSWTHNAGRNQNNTDTATVSNGVYRVWMSVTATTTGGDSESFNVDGNIYGW